MTLPVVVTTQEKFWPVETEAAPELSPETVTGTGPRLGPLPQHLTAPPVVTTQATHHAAEIAATPELSP